MELHKIIAAIWPWNVYTPAQTTNASKGLAVLSPTSQQVLYDAVRSANKSDSHPFFKKVDGHTWRTCKFLFITITIYVNILLTTFTDYAENKRPVISSTLSPQGTRTIVYLNGKFDAKFRPSSSPSTSNVAALNSSLQSSDRASTSPPPAQRRGRTVGEKKVQVKVKGKGKLAESKGKGKAVDDDVLELSSDEPAPKKKKMVLRSTPTPTYVPSESEEDVGDYESPSLGADLKRKAKAPSNADTDVRRIRSRASRSPSPSEPSKLIKSRPQPKPIGSLRTNLALPKAKTKPLPPPSTPVSANDDWTPPPSPSPASRTLTAEERAGEKKLLNFYGRPNLGRGPMTVEEPTTGSVIPPNSATLASNEATPRARPQAPVAAPAVMRRDQVPATAPIVPVAPVAPAGSLTATVAPTTTVAPASTIAPAATVAPTGPAAPANAAVVPQMMHAAHAQGLQRHEYEYAGSHNPIMQHGPPPQGYWGHPVYHHPMDPSLPHGYTQRPPPGYGQGYDAPAYGGQGYHHPPAHQHAGPSNAPYNVPLAFGGLPYMPPSSNARGTSPLLAMDGNFQLRREGSEGHDTTWERR